MDPLSIIAGVVGTAAVALHTSKRLWELIDGIVNGPTELVAMRRDTKGLFNILASLEPVLRERESKEDKDISDVIQRLNQPLDNCMETLKALEVLIQKSVKPTGELKKSRWRTFASTFREKEFKSLTDQLTSSKLTMELALTTINTIRSARIQKDTNKISGQIADLRADLRNADNDRVRLASVTGRKGSDSQTDFGFALERFLENVTVADQSPTQGSILSNLIERSESPVISEITTKETSKATSKETLVEEKAHRDLDKDEPSDRKRTVRRVSRIEFHPVNTSVYDGRKSLPSTYEDIKVVPIVFDANDTSSMQGNMPMHIAVGQGRIGVVEDLLLLNPDLEAMDDHGLTALHKVASATNSNQIVIMNILIARRASIDSKDDLGATPLHHAAWQGSKAAATILLRHGANSGEKDYAGWTPLHLAAYQGNILTAGHLLSEASGSIVDVVGPDATTALIWAAEKGHQDLVKLLLDNGASVGAVDRYGSSALHHAAANGFCDVIETLAAGGASVESENQQGARPLQVATQYGQSEAVETLLSLGANPIVSGPKFWPALHQAAGRGHVNIVNLLLSSSVFAEIRGQFNKTAIIWAAEIGQGGAVRSLIGHGANFNAQDQFGETALHYASANGHTEIVRVLASKGANLGISNNRRMHPLHLSVSVARGVYSTAKVLLEHGASAGSKDRAGYTPLHYAARNGNEDMVRLLLDHGADSQAMNVNGELAVSLAEKNGHAKVVKVLRESEPSSR